MTPTAREVARRRKRAVIAATIRKRELERAQPTSPTAQPIPTP